MRARLAGLMAAVAAVTLALVQMPVSAAPTFFPSVELKCPRTSSETRCSQSIEPDVKVAPDGTAYVSSIVGVPGGTRLWVRKAGETGFAFAGMPERIDRLAQRGFATGGGDTTVAVAPVANANGHHNVYIASLYAAGVTVATSRDSGVTWELNLLSAPITADRQWLVADGAETVWHAYVDFGKGALAVVSRSDDGGRVFGPPIPVYEFPEQQLLGTLARARTSAITIDRSGGQFDRSLYWALSNVETLDEAINNQIPGSSHVARHTVRVAISRDGGMTWSNKLIWSGPPTQRTDGVFPWIATDAGGNLYAVWTDTEDVYFSASTDGGETWSTPITIDPAPVNATVFPTIVGGRDGTVDIAFLGTTNGADVDDEAGLWDVYFAQSLNAADASPSFEVTVASDQPVHKGSVCLRGLGCNTTSPGNRNLAEVVTIDLDLDGMAIIATPYDYRNGLARPPQSLVIKQATGTRAFDSTLPVTGISFIE